MSCLIVFSGLPGVGKSTIARALSKDIGATYLRIDSIETALKNSTLRIYPADDAGYLAAIAVAKDNLGHGLNVVADLVNPVQFTRDWWANAARDCDAQLLNIEVVCNDTQEHRRRVETRRADLPGHKLPSWQDVQCREYEPWTDACLVLDAGVLSVEENVARVQAEL